MFSPLEDGKILQGVNVGTVRDPLTPPIKFTLIPVRLASSLGSALLASGLLPSSLVPVLMPSSLGLASLLPSLEVPLLSISMVSSLGMEEITLSSF